MAACSETPETADQTEDALFREVPSDKSGIEFTNSLSHTERLNTYTYRNFYNGAGVALGDVNNDGLIDIYLAGNQANNVLYLNKGNLVFEDITTNAGVACADVWSTGVSMADVNGDGYLDIYVCKSGPPEGENRSNELFINNGDLTFTEAAAEWNVDDKGLSNHAAFFDYDRDGDLDMYLLNNSLRSIGIYDLRTGQREIRDPEGGNKLYRHDGDHYTDVSEEAGIYGSAIGFGLGVTVADINRDQWPDIFVSNDFFERDYLYMNNGDGTFDEVLTTFTNEISMGSMGADIADLNNDGYPEIYVSEMLPSSLERIKTKTLFENWDKYQANVRNDYFHQFTRNTLQLNNGPSPEVPKQVTFSEVARLTQTHATDWSWGALLFDADNNGYRDIFVANGIYKDLTDQDYINFYSNNEILISRHRKDSTVLTTLIDKIPSVPLPNVFYQNEGDMSFSQVNSGLEYAGFSNGAAYGDLDNDGDLDLVVNNINDRALVYENVTEGASYLQLQLKGEGMNTNAFGANASVYTDQGVYFAEQQPVKGYMSSMDPRMHIGLGSSTRIDSVEVRWLSGKVTRLTAIAVDSVYKLSESEASDSDQSRSLDVPLLTRYNIPGLDTLTHHENEFNDFNRDQLLYEMYSNDGPPVEIADLNGDSLDDLVIGGASGEPLRVLFQQPDGSMIRESSEVFEADKRSEDTALALLDVDGDGDLDIYAGSGGNEFSFADPALKDRLYINNGSGFIRDEVLFPRASVPPEPTAFVLTKDIDNDGDEDIITGSRLVPFNYGRPASAYIFRNDGELVNATGDLATGFKDLGLLTDASWADLDGDGEEELVMVGEWMKPVAFQWEGSQFVPIEIDMPSGLYKSVSAADLNDDGKYDLILGNHGLNTRFRASIEAPMELRVNDYDENGRLDHILSIYENGVLYPLNLLQDLSKQMPVIRKKYTTFADYGMATTEEILSGLHMEGETRLVAEQLASVIAMNEGNGNWEIVELPFEAQVSPLYEIFVEDLDDDGISDMLLGGNQKRAKPELGIYNASFGLVLKGNGDGSFNELRPANSGIEIRGEIRSIRSMNLKGVETIVIGRNNASVLCYTK